MQFDNYFLVFVLFLFRSLLSTSTTFALEHTGQAVLGVHGYNGLENEILEALSNTKDCASCMRTLAPIKALAQWGDGPFVKTFTQYCISRKVADPDICKGNVELQGPIIAHALRKISLSGHSAIGICRALLGMCGPLPVRPYDVPFPKASPESIKPFVSRGREPFQVIHMSDIHIDRDYTIGADANCTKFICCRKWADDERDEIIEPAGPFGNRHCDSPASLVDSMLGAIKEHAPKALFTISTGDIVDHAIWMDTQEVVTDELHSFNVQLLKGLSHSYYGSLGNHDTSPTNAFARNTTADVEDSQWVFDMLSDDWTPWLGEEAASLFRHQSGSYSLVHPGTDLRIISINTQYWYKDNYWLYDSDEFQPDPNGVIAFIVQELQTAEDLGQRAWIFGHIPPGSGDLLRDQSNYFDQVVQRYRHTIAGQFYGHTHTDGFKVGYSDYSSRTEDTAVSFGLVAPSLTPTNGNPAFTVYDVDPDTYEIMDAKVFIANMTLEAYQVDPVWEFYYSARESYGPLVGNLTTTDSLDAKFWHRLTEVFEEKDEAFQMYVSRYNRGARPVRCKDKCKEYTICNMRAMRTQDNCDVNQSESLDSLDHACASDGFAQILKGLTLV